MTPELIAILAIGVALAGLILQGQRSLGARIDGVENSLSARIDGVESSLGARMDRIEAELREIRDRLSRLEGKMDFLEGYIVRRNEPGVLAE